MISQIPDIDADELPCRGAEQELWFADAPAALERAKALCQSCPAVTACLEGALDRREPWGVWGGQLLCEGRVIPRKRTRGRPRKVTAWMTSLDDRIGSHAL